MQCKVILLNCSVHPHLSLAHARTEQSSFTLRLTSAEKLSVVFNLQAFKAALSFLKFKVPMSPLLKLSFNLQNVRLYCCYGNLLSWKNDHNLFTNDLILLFCLIQLL